MLDDASLSTELTEKFSVDPRSTWTGWSPFLHALHEIRQLAIPTQLICWFCPSTRTGEISSNLRGFLSWTIHMTEAYVATHEWSRSETQLLKEYLHYYHEHLPSGSANCVPTHRCSDLRRIVKSHMLKLVEVQASFSTINKNFPQHAF
jgi:hypothetical protein